MFYHNKDAETSRSITAGDTKVGGDVIIADTRKNERIPVPSSLYDVAAVLVSSGLVDLQELLLVDMCM